MKRIENLTLKINQSEMDETKITSRSKQGHDEMIQCRGEREGSTGV